MRFDIFIGSNFQTTQKLPLRQWKNFDAIALPNSLFSGTTTDHAEKDWTSFSHAVQIKLMNYLCKKMCRFCCLHVRRMAYSLTNMPKYDQNLGSFMFRPPPPPVSLSPKFWNVLIMSKFGILSQVISRYQISYLR